MSEVIQHLSQLELSRRWHLSPRTLESWRWLGRGPRYLKVGGRVVYRVEDIEAYEAEQVRQCTASTVQAVLGSRDEGSYHSGDMPPALAASGTSKPGKFRARRSSANCIENNRICPRLSTV